MFCCVCSEIKACFIATMVFVLQMRGIFFVSAPFSLVFFGVVLFLVYFDLVAEMIGMHDPFSPFESVMSTILFSSWRRGASANDAAAADHQKTE